MESILRINSLTKRYKNLLVLDDLSFNVEKGEFVSVIGPSGCGKTTLLKIIGGLIAPTKGQIKLWREKNGLISSKRRFGFVFQDPVLLPWRNVAENISLPVEILSGLKPQATLKEVIKIVGLDGFENYLPNQLSGGMQQRAAIARALIFEPAILLMDEPFGSLDEITRNHMNSELLRIWQAEKIVTSTVVFVTHSISEAVFLSDKVIVLSKRPSKIKMILDINLPRPRNGKTKSSRKYLNLVECLRKTIKTE